MIGEYFESLPENVIRIHSKSNEFITSQWCVFAKPPNICFAEEKGGWNRVENPLPVKSLKTITTISLFGSAGSRFENIIKPVVYKDFCMHFPATVKKGCQKALRFLLFLVSFCYATFSVCLFVCLILLDFLSSGFDFTQIHYSPQSDRVDYGNMGCQVFKWGQFSMSKINKIFLNVFFMFFWKAFFW